MRIFRLYILFSLALFSLQSEEFFENRFIHHCDSLVEDMVIMGERCSGTNYVWSLLQMNFPTYTMHGDLYAKKHFFPWVDLKEFGISKKGKRDRDLNFLQGSNQTLFVLVVRNPYDWLRSFYAQPHFASKKMVEKGFFHFIKDEWKAVEGENSEKAFTDHWNPYENRAFANVLELRKFKMLNYLQIGLFVDHFLVVRYEFAAKHPQEFVAFVSETFEMQKNEVFQKVGSYKGEGQKKFQKKEYPPFKDVELQYVEEHLDWEVEEFVGYFR